MARKVFPPNFINDEGIEMRYCSKCDEFHNLELFSFYQYYRDERGKNNGYTKRTCNMRKNTDLDPNKEKREAMPVELSPLAKTKVNTTTHYNEVLLTEKVLSNIGYELYNPDRPVYEQFLERMEIIYGVSLRA